MNRIIREQFNINNMDFNKKTKPDNINIFNKNIINPDEYYIRMKKFDVIDLSEIEQLDQLNSIFKVKDKEMLQDITYYYAERFREHSLNWLDVSAVTDMSAVFYWCAEYVGDISTWDVSNVKTMSHMFCDSDFNGNISNWDVSNVWDMSYMFMDSCFTGDISGWNVTNNTKHVHMFANCPIKNANKPKFKKIP